MLVVGDRCELLKGLAPLSGFRGFQSQSTILYRLEELEVAAKLVMERGSGVNIVPHFCGIEDKELEFYSNFSLIALDLDSAKLARSYTNLL